jgi:glycosyltransferase involved in cell wall biosynthesis
LNTTNLPRNTFFVGTLIPFAKGSPMARIMHVITALDTGGAEMMLLKLLSTSNGRHEHAVVSLTNRGTTMGDRIAGLGVPVYTLSLRAAAPNPLRALSLRSLTRQFRPQLLQGWMYHGNLAASLAAGWTRNRPPVIWGVHHSLYDLAKERWLTAAVIRLDAWLSSHVANIIYVSQTSRKQHESLGYRAANGLVIPNGLDCQEFVPDESARSQVRGELGVAEHEVLVGLVARYHPMKDQAGFLRAAALVAGVHPEARFLLVGPGIQAQPALLTLLAQLGIGDRVFLLEERQDMQKVTAALDIACSSSAWGESFSITIGEAMACAVPCVVTDVGDSANIVLDTGRIVPPRAPDALAQAIGQLIASGSSYRRQLGAAARRRVEEKFSLPEMAHRYEAVYEKHLGRSL